MSSVLCVSLRWLGGMLPSNHPAVALCMEPLSSEGLVRDSVLERLTHPGLYCTVMARILPTEKHVGGFPALIQALGRQGVFITEVDVSNSTLSQANPFNEESHVAVMEGLMSLYTCSTLSLSAIVASVRRVSSQPLLASRDLPTTLSEGLLLWINRMPLVKRTVNSLTEGLSDGQALATLLLHYAPSSFQPSDFHLGESISPTQALHNVTTAVSFLVDHLQRPGFHILSHELRTLTGLECNITVLTGHLYRCLENKRSLSNTCNLSRVTSEPSLSKRSLYKTRLRSVSTHTLSSHPSHSSLPFHFSLESQSSHPSQEARRSFTVSTHHTPPTAAIAAGLPVISLPAVPDDIHLDIPSHHTHPPLSSQPSAKLQALRAVCDRIHERDRHTQEMARDERLLQYKEHHTSLTAFPGSPIDPLCVSISTNPHTVSNAVTSTVSNAATSTVSKAVTSTALCTSVNNPWTQSTNDAESARHRRRDAQLRARLSERRTPSAPGHESVPHNGPDLYVPPQIKSNKKLIKNAVSHVCLAGEANLLVKQQALEELEKCSTSHVMVLFRDVIGFKFRGLYSFTPESDQVVKVFGTGPKTVTAKMVAHVYKYNSGRKEFREILSKTLSVSVDAFTIQAEYWNKKTRK